MKVYNVPMICQWLAGQEAQVHCLILLWPIDWVTLWNQLRVIFAMQMEVSLIYHISW
jgi:hypothetical protein